MEVMRSSSDADNRVGAAVEKNDSFREFRRLCARVADESSYLGKTRLIRDYINEGHAGSECLMGQSSVLLSVPGLI